MGGDPPRTKPQRSGASPASSCGEMSKRRLVIGGEEVVAPAESPKPTVKNDQQIVAALDPKIYDDVRTADPLTRNRFVLRKLMVDKVCPVCSMVGFRSHNNDPKHRTTINCQCGTEITIFHGGMKHVRDIEGMTIIVEDSLYRERQAAMEPGPVIATIPINPDHYTDINAALQAAKDNMLAQTGIPVEMIRGRMSQQAAESPRARNGQTQYRETDNVLIAKFLSRLVCPDCTGKQLLTRRTQPNTTKFMCQDCPMVIELEWSGDIVKNGPVVRRLPDEG